MRVRALAFVLIGAVACGSLAAQSGGPYTITRSTVDAGGGLSSGGIYVVHGTIGQHDAAPTLTGGTFTLQPGFWAGASVDQGGPLPDGIFSDSFEAL